jgi:PhnB protein
MPVQTPPKGYSAVTPYLAVADAPAALAFYAEAFGARERMRLAAPDGSIVHAEIEIGGAPVMLSGAWPQMGFVAPDGSTVSAMIHLYVPDADAAFARAVAAGATALQPVQTQFYGDRSGTLRDPFGHRWSVSTQVEEVSVEEAQRRMAAMPMPGA